MERTLSEELEVPGHVVMYRTYTRAEGIARMRSLLEQWERQGRKCLNDVPEDAEKKEFRQICRQLGVAARF